MTQPLSPGRRPRVVIVGGGFGGLHAAKSLAGLPVDITLIDRRNHHTFQPLLYQVALAVLSPADIAQPIRTIFRGQKNTEVLMDEVTGIDTAGHIVETGSKARIGYDYLVLATGATHSYFGNEAWASIAPGLKTVEDATEIRRRVLLAFELAERHMQEHGWHPPLNFVVVGGGPTGVELAGAICDIARIYMRHDFRHINPAEARVLLLDGGDHVLAAYPLDLRLKAEKALAELGVEVHTHTQVTGIGTSYVDATANGTTVRFESMVTLWAAGVQASPLGKLLGVQLDRRGCVVVDNQLNPPSLPEVFILGDLAHFEQDGRQVPGVAQPAMQMGDFVGRAVEADLKGKPRPGFRYFDKGDMATIGRMAAVAKVEWPFKAHMSGLPAWVTWLVIHIFFLIGFRSRVRVFAAWVWTYFTFTFGARLITGDLHLPGWDELTAGAAQEADGKPEETAPHS
ncbi:MAG: NAD(P)/FAD-dependent oxidoreductase [Terracidiphilus sp.]|nr:NAD(P)/FAD-dependent oxidoreductase [Terracidiphilus sp.]